MRHATNSVLAVGQSISCPAGRYTVTIYTVRADVYRVEVRTGSRLIDELSRSFASEPLARAIARTITKALRAGADIDGARRAVVDHFDGQLAFLTADNGIVAANAAKELQRLKAWYDLDSEVWQQQMVAGIRALDEMWAS